MFRTLAAAVLCTVAAASSAAGDRDISAAEAWRLHRESDVTIVDVRSRAEWRETGIPKGARTLSIHGPEGETGFIRAISNALGGDRTRPVALICARGGRSARAASILENAGFTTVYNVKEGMLGSGGSKGWLEGGLPVEPCGPC